MGCVHPFFLPCSRCRMKKRRVATDVAEIKEKKEKKESVKKAKEKIPLDVRALSPPRFDVAATDQKAAALAHL